MSVSTVMVQSGEFNPNQVDLMLADDCARFYADPLGWVMWAFDWGVGELEGFDGPDQWQVDWLKDVGRQVLDRGFDGIAPVDPIRMATASGHGIGKSAITAWIILWIMSTRPHAKGVVTANTGDQLKTKTWGELGKWRSRSLIGHWFEYNSGKGSMSLYHRAYPDSWRVDAMTSREENSEAFAGLHSASSTPFYLFDEASAVPDTIWEVAEGGLTDGEPMFFVFGNPTRNTGRFYECFTRRKQRWSTRQIDSRTAKMTNKKLIAEWANDWGEDSDFFRVRVLGRFPRAGDAQFIPGDVVDLAQKRAPMYLPDDPLICGIDIARGGDDNCMVQFRRGKDARSEKVYRIPGEKSRDSMKVVSILTTVLDRHRPNVIFLDATGIGGPIGDRLRQLGYPCIDVHFGDTESVDQKKFKNKTAEMGYRCREWLQNGGAIRDDPQLELELTGREYGHNDKDQLQLERKKDMKKRIGASPDWADALYLTFANPVPKLEGSRAADDIRAMKHQTSEIENDFGTFEGDYDPLG